MPVTSTEVKSYTVEVVSNEEPDKLVASVWLFGGSGNTVAYLRFIAPGNALPANAFRADLGYPLVSFRSEMLNSIVDVLRNEKPIYFTWYDYRPARCFGSVGTAKEPVGDAE